MNDKIHAFEDRGLGKAPFAFVGIYSLPSKALAEQNCDAYNNALREMPPGFKCGTCSFCGMAIMHNYLIRSSDGKTFSVGCECVNKTGDEGMIKAVTAKEKERKRELREAAWRRRREKRENELAAKRLEEAEIERQRNGGMTLTEIGQLRTRLAAEILEPLAQKLHDGMGGFRQSISIDMANYGRPPRGKALNIVLDIVGRLAGRRSSKAYDLAYDEAARIIDGAEAIYEMANWQLVNRYASEE